MIKIIADSAIPLLHELFGPVANIETFPGDTITNTHLQRADVLLVRTVTKVNEELLQGTPVEFVGTMTAGTDHIDCNWLQKNAISFSHAAGANAKAVANHVVACIAYLQQNHLLAKKNLRAGIIGVGHVGRHVLQQLHALGIELVVCDPIRAKQEALFVSTEKNSIVNCDIISLHTPLTFSGENATHHLIDKNFLQQQNPGCVLINTSRGEVLHPNALEHDLKCLDVFAEEPRINVDDFSKATIATPHIAGYSQNAKLAATLIVYEAAQQIFEWQTNRNFQLQVENIPLSPCEHWQDIVLQAYNPYQESLYYKEKLRQDSQCFETLRRSYRLRPEFGCFSLSSKELNVEARNILQELGFNCYP